MNPKLAQTLIRLYPAQWRSRYGEEFAALLKDKNFTAEDSFDVILSAITERIRLLGESMPSNRETAINLAAVSYLAAAAGGINLVATIDDSPVVAAMHQLLVPDIAWTILSITGILAGICALASGASLYGRWLVSALHRKRQEALRLLFPPAAGLVLLFFWGALSLVMTHGKWIASPWAILPQGGAPALWPGLHFRWLFGAISTILSLEILFSLAVGFTKLSSLDVGETPYTNRTMRAKTTRWLLLITATSMVVAACSVFTWGAELSLRTPELLHDQFGVLGTTITVSWALSLSLFVIAALGSVKSARLYHRTAA
jgi:hypothetical protein